MDGRLQPDAAGASEWWRPRPHAARSPRARGVKAMSCPTKWKMGGQRLKVGWVVGAGRGKGARTFTIHASMSSPLPMLPHCTCL
jgi:hypothetical protein